MKKIGIIGHFGGKKEFFDGQTVKTKILNDELLRTGNFEIYKVDTYYVKRNPFKVFFQTVKSMFTCDSVIVLIAQNGMRVFPMILHILKKFTKTKTYHDVLGGDLPQIVEEHPGIVKYLNSFEMNWVEFRSMCDRLKAQGVENVSVLPNIKRLEAISECNEDDFGEKPMRFCTFSRVCKEKGITDAVEAIHKINNEFGEIVATLDIYGQVFEDYKEEFENLKKDFGDAIKYGGIIAFESSVETLKNYDALLFPTFYVGEGFPGTIIDCYHSALPVIATDWNANKEIIKDGITGIVYPNDKFSDLYSAVKWAVENGDEVINMKKNALEESKKYDADTLMKVIIDAIS